MSNSAGNFNGSIVDFIRGDSASVKNIRFYKDEYIYVGGGRGNFYFIEKGHVKVSTQTEDGRTCNIGFYKEGDFFGESGLSGDIIPETATALIDCAIKKINFSSFLEEIKGKVILYHFVIYMANKIIEHQKTISSFVIFNSEKRLAYSLMRMASEIKNDNVSSIKNKISYQDLSYMVGTTRSRVGYFMNVFLRQGIIKESKDCFLIVDKKRIEEYLVE
ncbi:Crp/Fnr family transcriptional regulator [Xenorhabdus budapestensis]|uniref:Crp/Fnr family transcriptional regulator n=1 Tax=Xenorhabdus budapestensis TaxID=290110 RepID=A0ABX7VFD2_XENBU|nr:Crp/Fnr family transcriptional regulator [Xenorhabdus budapestensis]QTL38552.1 Crp/Fnr family transcriptional regulator [Xenorhabdus budapestensis]